MLKAKIWLKTTKSNVVQKLWPENDFLKIGSSDLNQILGPVPASLGAPSPLKFFVHSRLGLARCFHMHFAMAGLVIRPN